jgi:sec-independent protein translocase protein TatB
VFDISPMDLLVLAFVGILVFGPERLPGLARDAGMMIRTLRELLVGTGSQLRDELGPEFADFRGTDQDLRKALAKLLAEDAQPSEPACVACLETGGLEETEAPEAPTATDHSDADAHPAPPSLSAA